MKEEEWFQEKVRDQVGQMVRVRRRILSEETPFQRIEVFDTDQFGRVMALDGAINLAEKDEFIYHEMLAHVPMCVHPRVESLLVVGGGDGGVVREVLKHPVGRVDLVEIDQRVIEVTRRYFPEVSCGLDDPRVHIHIEDGTLFVQGAREAYDVIVVDSTDPIGVGASLYEETFYRHVFSALRSGGIVTTQTESPFFDQDIIKDLYPKLREVFPIVRTYLAPVPFYPGTLWSFAFCSKGVDPLADFNPSGTSVERIETYYYDSEVHRGAFIVPRCMRDVFDKP
ncbi:MAG: polyamine aminopropyltransferase [Deltaproteobacteria bacterium]|nr:polyamine aminopropyltransferase [Deltaproteobacteria bacterium]MBW2123089.1 polyamine aminopropyltransferase [Deltaproteobacteria bacterium]